MTKIQTALSSAFFAGTPCEIVYRDKAGRWSERTVRIAEEEGPHRGPLRASR